MDGTQGSSPVTHNVYTTGSGATDGGGSSALHSLIPALMMGNQNNSGMQHLPALAAAAMAGGGGYRGAHAGIGAAAGGAIGFVLGALLNGNGGGGLFGGNRNNVGTDNLVTTTELNTALNAQTANQNTNAILQQLAAIAVAIPENEGKVQLALSQSQIALMNQATQGQLAVAATQYALTNNIADARHNINDNIHTNALNNANNFAAVNAGVASSTAQTNAIVRQVKDTAEAGFSALQLSAAQLGLQAANNTSAIFTAIRDDGDKTRALVTSFNDATLNRIIVTQANEIIELKNDRTSKNHGLEITQTVNTLQAQSQAQQQQQQQFGLLANINAQLAGIHQLAAATNQNLIIGNTGAVATGPQTANPVNVNS